MLDHAQEAVNLTRGKLREDLDANRLLELSLVRLREIIGEGANRVSPGFQSQYPHIPWPQIVSLRHRLIHGYNSVDVDILWEILTKDSWRAGEFNSIDFVANFALSFQERIWWFLIQTKHNAIDLSPFGGPFAVSAF